MLDFHIMAIERVYFREVMLLAVYMSGPDALFT